MTDDPREELRQLLEQVQAAVQEGLRLIEALNRGGDDDRHD